MPARSKARSAARLSKAQYEMLAAFRYQLRQFLHFSERRTHPRLRLLLKSLMKDQNHGEEHGA
jgi:hypothetical protein